MSVAWVHSHGLLIITEYQYGCTVGVKYSPQACTRKQERELFFLGGEFNLHFETHLPEGRKVHVGWYISVSPTSSSVESVSSEELAVGKVFRGRLTWSLLFAGQMELLLVQKEKRNTRLSSGRGTEPTSPSTTGSSSIRFPEV